MPMNRNLLNKLCYIYIMEYYSAIENEKAFHTAMKRYPRYTVK